MDDFNARVGPIVRGIASGLIPMAVFTPVYAIWPVFAWAPDFTWQARAGSIGG